MSQVMSHVKEALILVMRVKTFCIKRRHTNPAVSLRQKQYSDLT